ncbi:MAG: hypothetical protein WCQ41_01660 [Bacillota bacterium]
MSNQKVGHLTKLQLVIVITIILALSCGSFVLSGIFFAPKPIPPKPEKTLSDILKQSSVSSVILGYGALYGATYGTQTLEEFIKYLQSQKIDVYASYESQKLKMDELFFNSFLAEVKENTDVTMTEKPASFLDFKNILKSKMEALAPSKGRVDIDQIVFINQYPNIKTETFDTDITLQRIADESKLSVEEFCKANLLPIYTDPNYSIIELSDFWETLTVKDFLSVPYIQNTFKERFNKNLSYDELLKNYGASK